MTQLLIDTNGYLRWLLNDIPSQAEHIERALRQAEAGHISIFMPQIVAFELVYILSKYYQLPKITVIQQLQTLLSSPLLEVEHREILLSALECYGQKKLSFSDCFLAVLAQAKSYQVLTFDQELQKNLSSE